MNELIANEPAERRRKAGEAAALQGRAKVLCRRKNLEWPRVRFPRFQQRSGKEVDYCLATDQSQGAEIEKTSRPHGSDRRCNVIFTLVSFICFYFQFYSSVLQLSAIVVYLSSQQAQQSASEPKVYSATVPNSASEPNSASVPNLDNASGHKAVKETEKPLTTEFSQNKAKTNDNCSRLYIGQRATRE